MKKVIKTVWKGIVYKYLIFFNRIVREQRCSPDQIPVIIINYNQLENLTKLVKFLQDRQVKNIIIIDNKSDYGPLLEYYKSLNGQVTVELMSENHGHMVFFENKNLQEKYGKGYYFVTDADIIPNPNLPQDYISQMLKVMDRYNEKITKVGFALDLNTIPEYYPLREKVINWEKKFWEVPLDQNIFLALVDTTFALYKPGFPTRFKVKHDGFYDAIRMAGSFTCQHMGWYLDPNNLSNEQKHYMSTSSSSNSWKFDEKGDLKSLSAY